MRRASSKCLAAVIASRPEMLSRLYEEVYIDKFQDCIYNSRHTLYGIVTFYSNAVIVCMIIVAPLGIICV